MTREKKELLKQLREISLAESADYAMDGSGECGEMISKHYDTVRQPIVARLDELMHGRLADYLNITYYTFKVYGYRSGLIKITIDCYQYADLCYEYWLHEERLRKMGITNSDEYIRTVLAYNN